MSHCFVVLFNVVLTLYLFLKIILDWVNENLKESLWGVDDKQEKGKKLVSKCSLVATLKVPLLDQN